MLMLGLVLLAAVEVAPEPQSFADDWRVRQACVAVKVSSQQQEGVRRKFSASQALDLRITAAFDPRLRGRHRLELEVYTPQGHLYQTLSVPFDASGPREAEGWAAGRRTASATLPVGGTAITTGSLYGRWRVVPHLDGAADPCGRHRRFRIEQ